MTNFFHFLLCMFIGALNNDVLTKHEISVRINRLMILDIADICLSYILY